MDQCPNGKSDERGRNDHVEAHKEGVTKREGAMDAERPTIILLTIHSIS